MRNCKEKVYPQDSQVVVPHHLLSEIWYRLGGLVCDNASLYYRRCCNTASDCDPRRTCVQSHAAIRGRGRQTETRTLVETAPPSYKQYFCNTPTPVLKDDAWLTSPPSLPAALRSAPAPFHVRCLLVNCCSRASTDSPAHFHSHLQGLT